MRIKEVKELYEYHKKNRPSDIVTNIPDIKYDLLLKSIKQRYDLADIATSSLDKILKSHELVKGISDVDLGSLMDKLKRDLFKNAP